MRAVPFRSLAVAVALFCGASAVCAQAVPQDGGDFSHNPQPKKLPTDVILVKGAWASASDSSTPVPEGGNVVANDSGNVYRNPYFGLAFPLASGWTQKYAGPPPSDSGYYVLAQFAPATPADPNKESRRGNILIAAQDLFFTTTPAGTALELVQFRRARLGADYRVERDPMPVNIAGHSFIRFDYTSPVAGLHWYVLATQSRCHLVQFVFTSRDTELIEGLIRGMDKLKLPAEASPLDGTGGNDEPVCITGYARPENVLERIEPVFAEHRFNPVPVRIVIDKDGRVKHIHFLSAFPEQSKAITDALMQWRFKPCVRGGGPVEVETGIMFGRAPQLATPAATAAVNE